MQTLIITVGTRQVGWRCQDGVLRCLGADGDRNHPPHIDELYARELGIERGCHQPGNDNSRWSVRDLGDRLYQQCQASQDFSRVELLLDRAILEDGIKAGLSRVILWGTDQPDTVPWQHRRADTLWLVQLMEGAIQQTWPQLAVDSWISSQPLNRPDQIRQEFEAILLPDLLSAANQATERGDRFVLVVQNKGCAPQVAETLQICIAALVRQCDVQIALPIEPSPLYETVGEFQAARVTEATDRTTLSEHFWPVERARIESAWQRGDFGEVKIWLEAHRSRQEALYKLAGHLALATNWQIREALKGLQSGWLRAQYVSAVVSDRQRLDWQEQLSQLLPTDPRANRSDEQQLRLIWESSFLVMLPLEREDGTMAFWQFAQLLERLLFWQSEQGNWRSRGYIQLPPNYQGNPAQYTPSLGGLNRAWLQSRGANERDPVYQVLERIRENRNQLVHRGSAMTLQQIRCLWTEGNLFPYPGSDTPPAIWGLMRHLLQAVVAERSLPETSLLRSLYDWGLECLRA